MKPLQKQRKRENQIQDSSPGKDLEGIPYLSRPKRIFRPTAPANYQCFCFDVLCMYELEPVKVKVKVKVTLQLTVRQSVLVSRPIWGCSV
jgi:hypothetical protein